MFKTFRDTNAELMRKLASEIAAPVERFASTGAPLSKTGPISGQFFPQEELFVHPLNTTEMVESQAGAEHAARWKFREQMRMQYPGHPEMWSLDPPSVTQREYAGGMFWPVSSSKANPAADLSKTSDRDARDAYAREMVAREYANAIKKALAARA